MEPIPLVSPISPSPSVESFTANPNSLHSRPPTPHPFARKSSAGAGADRRGRGGRRANSLASIFYAGLLIMALATEILLIPESLSFA